MNRNAMHFILFTAGFLALIATDPARMLAQQATPAATPPPGVTRLALGSGAPAEAPGRVLLLAQRTFGPGAASGSHPAPGPVVLAVKQGTIGFAITSGTAFVSLAGTTGTPTAMEPVTVGTEALLNPGDSVFYEQGVVHTVRNAGAGSAITLEARLNPTS